MKVLIRLIAILLLSGCGGGDGKSTEDNSNPEAPTPDTGSEQLKGYFLDSFVSGVDYSVDGSIGKTINGSFLYEKGSDITFSIGKLELGTIKAKELVTPFDFEYPLNVARILQTLDNDHNPNNGIYISDNVKQSPLLENSQGLIDNLSLEENLEKLRQISALTEKGSREIVNINVALVHLSDYTTYAAIDKLVTGGEFHSSPWDTAYGYNQKYSKELLASCSHLPEINAGIDILAPIGTNVYSLTDGKVIDIDPEFGAVFIEPFEQQGILVYKYMSEVNLSLGDIVSKTQFIGKSGNQGNECNDTPILHLEWLYNITPEVSNLNKNKQSINKVSVPSDLVSYDLKNLSYLETSNQNLDGDWSLYKSELLNSDIELITTTMSISGNNMALGSVIILKNEDCIKANTTALINSRNDYNFFAKPSEVSISKFEKCSNQEIPLTDLDYYIDTSTKSFSVVRAANGERKIKAECFWVRGNSNTCALNHISYSNLVFNNNDKNSDIQITDIPSLMTLRGWSFASELMDTWFLKKGLTYKEANLQHVISTDSNTKEAVDKFKKRARENNLVNSVSQKSLVKSLIRSKIDVLNNGGEFDFISSEISDSDLKSEGVKNTFNENKGEDDRLHFIINKNISGFDFFDFARRENLSEVIAALNNFHIRLVVSGNVEVEDNGNRKINIKKGGLYLFDSYDFIDDDEDFYSQPLGCWSYSSPYVDTIPFNSSSCFFNKDFKEYMDSENAKSGLTNNWDFHVYSDPNDETFDMNESFIIDSHFKFITTKVTSITPIVVEKGVETLFTIKGTKLFLDTEVHIQDCEASSELSFIDSTQIQLSCIPRSNGIKKVIVKEKLSDQEIEGGNDLLIQVISEYELPTLSGGVNIVDITGGFRVNSQEATGEDEYEFYRSTSSGDLGSLIHIGTTQTYDDTGLSNDLTYYYTIKACNVSGCTSSSQDYKKYVEAVSPPTLSGGVNIVDITGGFRINSQEATGEDEYKFYRSTSSGSLGSLIHTGTTHTYDDTGLSNNTTYYYTIKACNSGGCTSSSQDYKKYVEAVSPPTLSGGVNIVDITGGFRINSQEATGEDEYKFYRSTSSGSLGSLIHTGTTHTYDDTGLSNNTTYYYTIKACNSGGCTSSSQDYKKYVEAVSPPTLSGGVNIVDITGGFRINSQEATGEDEYKFYRSTSSGSLGSLIHTGTTRTYDDTGLSNNTTYYYTIKACNSGGCTSSSQDYKKYVEAVSPPTLSGGVNIVDITGGFRINSQEATGEDEYKFYRSTSSGSLGSLIHTGTTRTYDDTGLSNNTTYYYTIKACNSGGCASSSQDYKKYVEAVSPPTLSGGVNIVDITGGFRINSQEATGEDEYKFYRSTSSGSLGSLIHTGTTRTYDDTGLSNNTTYYYTIKACNTGGCASSSQDYKKYVEAVSPPTLSGGVNIVDITGGFRINSQEATGEDEYKFYRSTSSGSLGSLIHTGTTHTYDDTGLSNNTTYYYTIKACNSGGCASSSQDYKKYVEAVSPPTLSGGVNIVDITGGFRINSQEATGEDEYKFYRSTSSGSLGSLIHTGTTRTYDDTGLSNNTTYYYTIKACNSGGCASSSQDYKKYVEAVSPPTLSGGVNIVDITGGFRINSQEATGEDEYKFYRSTSSGSLGSLIHTGTTRTYDDTGLSNNTTYYYTIKACNTGGCASSSQDYKKYVEAVSPPTLSGGVNIVDITGGFRINSQEATGEDEYKFYRSTSSGSLGSLIHTGTTRTYDDTGLSNNTTYYYTIKACNSGGCTSSSQDYKLFTL